MRATDKQIAFIVRLRAERDLGDANGRLGDLLAAHEEGTEEITADRASQIIEFLLKAPVRAGYVAASGLDLTALASGRYAVGGLLVKVDNLTEAERGRWAGWVFVKNGSEYVDERFGSQAPGGSYRGQHADLLAEIVADPTAAMQQYGRITGTCAVCGRTLEDEVSVARGIGPVCWEKVA